MCGLCEEGVYCPRHATLGDGRYWTEREPETVWEQLDREASGGNQPAEFIGGAR